MGIINRIIRNEPVALINTIRLAILAGAAFGLHISDANLIVLMALVEAVLTLVSRNLVTANDHVEAVAARKVAERFENPGEKLPGGPNQ